MKVLFKKTAIDDIRATAAYISDHLHNKAAAKKWSEAVYHAAMMLGGSPCLGARLSGKFDVETDLHFLIVSKHLLFYRVVDGELIEVTRVLDGRQDYLSILF